MAPDMQFVRLDDWAFNCYATITDLPYELIERILLEARQGCRSFRVFDDPVLSLASTCRWLLNLAEPFFTFELMLDFAVVDDCVAKVQHLYNSDRLRRRLRSLIIVIPDTFEPSHLERFQDVIEAVVGLAPYIDRIYVDVDRAMDLHRIWARLVPLRRLRHVGIYHRGLCTLREPVRLYRTLYMLPQLETLSVEGTHSPFQDACPIDAPERRPDDIEEVIPWAYGHQYPPMPLSLTRLVLRDRRLADGDLTNIVHMCADTLRHLSVSFVTAHCPDNLTRQGLGAALRLATHLTTLEVLATAPNNYPGSDGPFPLLDFGMAPVPSVETLIVTPTAVTHPAWLEHLFPGLRHLKLVGHPEMEWGVWAGRQEIEDIVYVDRAMRLLLESARQNCLPKSFNRISGLQSVLGERLGPAILAEFLARGIFVGGVPADQRHESDPKWRSVFCALSRMQDADTSAACRFMNGHKEAEAPFLPLMLTTPAYGGNREHAID